jgi:ribosomal protein L3 glutamine methyltransferase
LFLILQLLRLPIDDPNLWFDAKLTPEEKETVLYGIQTRITQRKPSAYILNVAYYHGDPFYVDERVLIPRSYIGEILLNEEYVNKGNEYHINQNSVRSILDLCTGSGCLAVHASKVFESADIIHAADISKDCIEVATKNIADKGLEDLIIPKVGDLFDFPGVQKYDLIICNPPYVDGTSMDSLPPEYRCEPRSALLSGPDGIALLTRILKESSRYLNDKGVLLCEVGKRGLDIEKAYPKFAHKIYWLNTELSEGEVFLAKKADLISAFGRADF